MNTTPRTTLYVRRFLSLTLLFAGTPALAEGAWPFAKRGHDLGVEVTTYACAEGRSVTLIPTLHFAEPAFYDAVEAKALEADHVVYEGVRPAGFFGPPFEDDDRANAPRTPRDVTAPRIRTVTAQVEAFRQSHARNPESLAEVFAPFVAPGGAEAFARRILVDYWGTPLQLRPRADGRLAIVSLGADREPGHDDFGLTLAPPPNTPALATEAPPTDTKGNDVARGVDDYQKLGRALGLALQIERPHPSQWRDTSVDADVSIDMVGDDGALALRNALALRAVAKTPSGARVALVYGAAHAADLRRGLVAAPLNCAPTQTETWTVLRADGTDPAGRAGAIDEILAAFAAAPTVP